MDEATYERMVDLNVQRRLATDRAYKNAENAEEQAEREAEITREECERMDRSIEKAAFARRMEQARR
jgi:hypothetical protein